MAYAYKLNNKKSGSATVKDLIGGDLQIVFSVNNPNGNGAYRGYENNYIKKEAFGYTTFTCTAKTSVLSLAVKYDSGSYSTVSKSTEYTLNYTSTVTFRSSISSKSSGTATVIFS